MGHYITEDKMKKLFGSLFILGFLMLISGCGNPGTAKDLKVNDEVTVTIRDLQANDWVVEGLDDKADDKLVASFSDHVITFNIDTSTGRWKEIEKDLAKSMAEELTFEFEYSLKGNKLIRKIDDSGEEVEYKVAKEDDKILLVPVKESENKITLSYKEKETDSPKNCFSLSGN